MINIMLATYMNPSIINKNLITKKEAIFIKMIDNVLILVKRHSIFDNKIKIGNLPFLQSAQIPTLMAANQAKQLR